MHFVGILFMDWCLDFGSILVLYLDSITPVMAKKVPYDNRNFDCLTVITITLHSASLMSVSKTSR
jgi:hypothetical protein